MTAQKITPQPADRSVDGTAAMQRRAATLESAIRRANTARAEAFRETIGALWRLATRPGEIGASAGVPGSACPST